MKKLFAFLLTLIMVLTLVACGGKEEETSAGNEEKAPSSSEQQEDKTPEADPAPAPEDKAGSNELFDVTDDQITAADGLDVSVIPEAARKGIGTLKSGGFDLKLPSLSSYSAQCEITYFDVSEDGFNMLLDYYKANGGEVSETFGSIEAVFDWGKIVPIYHADQKQISLTVYVSGEATGDPWPESDITALVPTPAQGKVSIASIDDTSAIIEVSWTYDEVLAYVGQLNDAGFGEDIIKTFEEQKTVRAIKDNIDVLIVYLDDTWTQINITVQ